MGRREWGRLLPFALLAAAACSSAGSPGAPSRDGGAPSGSSSGSGTLDSGSGGSSGSSSGGGVSGSGSGSSSGSSSGAGGDDGGAAACGCNGKSGCAVWSDVFITWYGFNDNSCTTEHQHDCNDIAFPGLGPQKHMVATEGAGTYDDPITCAVSAQGGSGTSDNESSGGATAAPGTFIYNPEVRKYFIVEDSCAECYQDFACEPDDDTSPDTQPPSGCKKDAYLHVDFWMGPSFMQDATNLNDCEDNSTFGNPYAGTGVLVVNPPSDLPVDTTPLYTGTGAAGGCWTSQQVAGDSCP